MSLRPAPLLLTLFLCVCALAENREPVATFEPACPQAFPRKGEPKIGTRVTIRYNPAAKGATLKQASAINVLVGGIGPGWSDTLLRIPMAQRSDGLWEAAVEPKNMWTYMIYYFQEGSGRVDDNRTRYWDVLGCHKGVVFDQAVQFQARTYTGEVIGSGIARQLDYGRAVDILEADIQAHPDHEFNLLATLWRYKVKRDGDNEQAWRKIAREVGRYLDVHKKDKSLLRAAGNFIGSDQRLPHWVAEQYLNVLRPYEREYADFKRSQELNALLRERDPATKLKLCREFLASYPDDRRSSSMYPLMFGAQALDLKDLPGAEDVFQAWRRADPTNPDAYASMARLYIDRGEKLEEAERLLAKAFELYTGDRSVNRTGALFVSIEVGYMPERDLPWLRFLRGKLRLAEGKPAEAVPDLEAAAKYFENRQQVWFTLGEAQEQAGRKQDAINSYLEAATVPSQDSSAAQEALLRLFAEEGPGGTAKLEEKLVARILERRAKAAAEYAPKPINRALSDFRVTTLAGREVTAKKLRGRPAIVNVWAAWCAGCMIELPRLDEFQKRHREVTVLAVATSSKPEDVHRIMAKQKLSAMQMAIADGMLREFDSSGVPTTAVIDRKGRIRFVHNDMPDVIAILEKDLAYLAAEK